MKKQFAFFVAVLVSYLSAQAQTNPIPQALPYTEDFSALPHSSGVYPNGWQGWNISTSPGSTFNTSAPIADRTLTASSGASTNSGNVHNYNGKIGFLNNASLDLSLVLAVSTTGSSNVQVAYDVMTLRNPYDGTANTRINELTLQYRVGTTGSFTNLSGIEYQNNTALQTGSGITTPQNPQSKLILLPGACDNQPVVQLRWVNRQLSGAGARPSFAVDNIGVNTANTKLLVLGAGGNASEQTVPAPGTFNLTFNPATAGATTFNYALSGTATFGTDYTATITGGSPGTLASVNGAITVPASTSAVTITITPIDDNLAEGAESVTLTLSALSGGYQITDNIESVNIQDDEATRIHIIQGSGNAATPGLFTVEGIVTGIYATLSPAGFYMQEEDADADVDPATSEGIFIVSNAAVSVGDKVRVGGTVLESAASPSFQQAVMTNTTVTTLTSNNPLPSFTSVILPVSVISDYERYEGMLVRFPDTLTVTDNFNLGRFGEINLSKGGLVYQATQLADPNDAVASGTTSTGSSNVAAVNALTLDNALRTILMDDGRGTIPSLPFVNADNTLRIGSTVNGVSGILGFAFSVYRIQPIPSAPPVFNYAPRPTVPQIGAHNVKVASFNVLNYFNGNGQGAGFPTPRGANSPAEFVRQRVKIINAIAEINADVVGLIELENDGTGNTSALYDLVSGLNDKMGAGTYAFVNDGASIQTYATDAIRCAIIYKPATVRPNGSVMIGADPVFNRPPVAQAFTALANCSDFNYVINHLKSKSCGGSSGADLDQLDGQACFNQTRKLQAAALARFIDTLVIPASGTKRVISMGDYNAYFEEDPLDLLRSSGYKVLSSGTEYSYLFFGQLGSLDHAIVTDSLLPYVSGVAKWHINSAEPVHLDYNDIVNDGGGDVVNPWGATYSTIPFRSSDHDPIIVGLNLPAKMNPGNAAKPVVSGCPGNFAVFTGPGTTCTQTATWTPPTASGGCGGPVSGTSNYQPGDAFPLGSTQVRYTFIDADSNVVYCWFYVTVIDNTPPTIVTPCPADMTVYTGPGDVACRAKGMWTPPAAVDNCSTVNTTSNYTPTSWLNVGTVTVNYNFRDAKNNTSSCSFNVTVVDNTPPIARCKPYTLTLVNGTGTVTAANINNSSTDNCGIGSMTVSPSTFTCAQAGTVQPVVLTVTDIHGNSSTCTSMVTVRYLPTCAITVTPSNTTYTGGVPTNIYLGYGPQSARAVVAASGGSGFTYSWSPSANLSCTNCFNPLFTPTAPGTYTYTATVTNSNGCSTTCTVTLCVKDVRAPGSTNVYICHEGTTMSVTPAQAATHLSTHPADRLGMCDQTCGQNNARMVQGNSSVVGDEVKVYPNPNKGAFIVELPFIEDAAQIMVTDVQGRLIARRVVTDADGSKVRFELGDVARGMYFVEVVYADQRFRVKLLVE